MDNEKETVMTDEKEPDKKKEKTTEKETNRERETNKEIEKDKEQDTETTKERIYESDLMPEEKRALEIEKLKAMTFWQKAEYIWTYYKVIFAAILGVAVLVYIGVVVFRNAQQKELLSVTIVDAALGVETDVTELEEDLLNLLGTGDEHEMITIDTGASSGNGYVAVMKMNVVMSENGTDILICDDDLYQEYEKDGAFKDWKEILGDDYAKYEPYIEDGKMSLEMSEKWKDYRLISYSPVYISVTSGSDKEEEAKQLVQFFLDE